MSPPPRTFIGFRALPWWFRRRADGVGAACDAFGGVRACSGAMHARSVSVLRDIIAYFQQCFALRRVIAAKLLGVPLVECCARDGVTARFDLSAAERGPHVPARKA